MCFTQVVTMSVTTTITNEKCHFQNHSLRHNQTTLLPQGANHPQYGLVSVYHLDFTLRKLKSKNLWTSILCHFLQAQKGFELAKAQADKKRILILTNFSFFIFQSTPVVVSEVTANADSESYKGKVCSKKTS